MDIKHKYGVEDIYFYRLTQISDVQSGVVYTCATNDLASEMGIVREYQTGRWRQDPVSEEELNMILKDLDHNDGKIYFLDTKKHYTSLEILLKDYYKLISIRRAVIVTKKPEVKND